MAARKKRKAKTKKKRDERLDHPAIIAYREKHGKFKTVADLTKVKGIGNKLLQKNEGLILVKKPGK